MTDPATPSAGPSDEAVTDPEDAKLVVLARGARGRAGTPTGAAVRDDDGRTYAAGDVRLASLGLSALQAAVAAAVSSGARRLEAAVVVTDGSDDTDADRGAQAGDVPIGRAAVAELGAALLITVDPSGSVLRQVTP
ncbi:cytidine deaminase [Nakamurella leprariae]|uniref:Cytidine deaminase n=1 Tax=Nakamurella leprariae TaxID=2803911 RepID=A0A938YGC9_9ACTN|nr:cytidine deaminase [Nakamurella leprariae]MBM9467315.1 cytidine deaminase [Nakamurella leprariae]